MPSYILLHSCFLFFVQLRSFSYRVLSKSLFSPYFHSSFLFFSPASILQVPFFAKISPSGFSSVSSPHDSFSRGDEQMEISNQKEYDEMSHHVLSETHGYVDCIQRCLDMADFAHEEVYVRISQILHLRYTLRDINEKHCKDIVKSMRQHGFHYTLRLITVLSQLLKVPWCHCVLNFSGGERSKGFKGDCFLVIVYGLHRFKAIEIDVQGGRRLP